MYVEELERAAGTSESYAPALTFETMEPSPSASPAPDLDRQSMEVDIACAGFGPAMGGFLSTLTGEWTEHPDDPAFQSKVAPGMPLQVLCYERADDIASGVSGVVTRAQGIRASFPGLDPAEIPMAANVTHERVLYLLDPTGASRRSAILRSATIFLRLLGQAARRARPRLRTPLDPELPPQARRPRSLHRPIQPVGRLAADGHRPGADLARHSSQQAADYGQKS